MNYSKLFFHAILINSLLISTTQCVRTVRTVEQRKRVSDYTKAVIVYTNLKGDRLYTSEGEKAAVYVQMCLTSMLNNDDSTKWSKTIKSIIDEQATTEDLLNKDHLVIIAKALIKK